MIDFGIVRPGSTIYVPFDTFAGSTGASVTMSGLAVGDIRIYKDGGTTERASTSGFTLLDTDGIDFDAITGLHGVSINLADNTTAGFYTAGSRYMIGIASITVDGQTVNFWVGRFEIGYPDAIINTTIATLSTQTSFTLTNGPAEADALVGCPVLIHDIASAVQLAYGIVTAYAVTTKTITLLTAPTFTIAAGDNISVYLPSNSRWIGAALPANATIGTVTTLTNLPAITDNWLTATGIATGAITSAKFAAGAIDAAAIATDAIGAAELAADAVAEIQSGLATSANQTTILNRLGAITGSGVNTILGFFQALLRSDASNPTDIGGTYDAATDSLQASQAEHDATQAAIAALNDPTAAAIADAVWDEAIAAHVGAGSFGEEVQSHALSSEIAALNDLSAAEVNAEVDTALADANLDHLVGTATGIPAIVSGTYLDQITRTTAGTFDRDTDSLEAIRDRGDAAWTSGAGSGLTPLASGTAQSGTTSTIQLAAGETFANDELNGNVVKITSGTGAGQARVITDYVGATDTATVTPNWITTPDATSAYEVVEGSVNVTAVSNVAEDLPTATNMQVIDDNVDAVLADTADMQPKLGTITNLGSGATIGANLVDIEAQTDDIGVAGAGLTAVPWNAAWDAEVQSEVEDGLAVYDPPTHAELVSEIDAVQADIAALTIPTAATIADAVWDEELTGATHNVPASAGRRLRGVQDNQAYDDGAIWVDTVNGTAGTTVYENGTSGNPVSTLADALTLATAANVKHLHIVNGSTITLASTVDNFEMTGDEWGIALGAQSCDGLSIHNAHLSGVGVSGTFTGNPHILHSTLGAITGPNSRIGWCALTGTVTSNGTGTWVIHSCWGLSGAQFDFGAGGAQTIYITDWLGGPITIAGMAAGDVLYFEGRSALLTLAASCTGGTVYLAGDIALTNSGSGQTINQTSRYELTRILADSTAFNGADVAAILADTADMQPKLGIVSDLGSGATIAANLVDIEGQTDDIGVAGAGLTAVPWNAAWDAEVQSEVEDGLAVYDPPTHAELVSEINDVQADIAALSIPTSADIADAVWDEVLTGVTHNVPASSGRRLRNLAGQAIIDGIAVSGSSNSIVLDGTASTVNGAYDPTQIAIVEGTGAGQSRLIMQYDGAPRTAYVDRDWKVVPDATSEYVILSHPGREHVNEGLAQAGGAASVTLNNLASADNNAYVSQIVFIRSGVGADQVRLVSAYDGATKVATVSEPWDTVPDATSVYVMLPTHVHELNEIADAVWDEVLAGHLTAGTTGEALDNASSGSGLTAQQVRDAMLLAPTPGAPAADSIDDKLDALETQISLLGCVYVPGAIEYTYTVTDSVTLLPIEGVKVWITTDAAGLNVVYASLYTDTFGVARHSNGDLPWLDAGNYYFWKRKANFVDDQNPDLEVVV